MARKSTTKYTSMSKKYANPEQFMTEMVDLATQSPQDAADVAATWRERFHNVTEGTAEALYRGLGFAVTIATGFAMSAWEGNNEAAADDMVEKWLATPEASAAAVEANVDLMAMSDYDREQFAFAHMETTDPRKIPYIGLDKVLGVALVLGGIAVFKLAKGFTPFIEAGAVGSAVAFASSIGYRVGKTRKEEALSVVTTE